MRARLEDWAYDAIARIGGRAGKPSFTSQFQALATSGIDLESFMPKVMADLREPEKIDFEGLRDPMTQTVLPNLLRVGLVPERLRQGYLAQGWRIDTAQNSIEDLHTFHADTQAARADFRARGVDFSRAAQAGR